MVSGREDNVEWPSLSNFIVGDELWISMGSLVLDLVGGVVLELAVGRQR